MSDNKTKKIEKFNKLENKNNIYSQFILYDRTLLWLTLGLSVMGLVMVTSSSMPTGQILYNDSFFFIKRELFYFSIIFIIGCNLLCIPMIFWKKISNITLIISMILLFCVFLSQNTTNNFMKWLNIGFTYIQPSEFCKISSLLYISNYLSRKLNEVRKNFWDILKPISIIGIQSILLLLEMDLGTTITLFFTSISIFFISGAKIKPFLTIISMFFTIIVISIFIKFHLINNTQSYWNIWDNLFQNNDQLKQSLTALHQGGLFGQGLGNSSQKFSNFYQAHEHFIFSIIGEELGYIGTLLILLMLFIFSFRAIYIGKQSLKNKKLFSGFLACSFGVWFNIQILINISTITGLLPITSSNVPFMSYGISNLITMMIATVFLLRIDFENRLDKVQAFPKN